MFLRNCWYVAGWSGDFPADGVVARTMLNESLVIYRKNDGTPVAMEDRCCHRLAPLSLGRKEGDDLRCLYHGMRFDAAGKCVEIPGQDVIPPTAKVQTFPVVERDDWVWIWMGEARLADPKLIPQAFGIDQPDYVGTAGHLAYRANYRLINDNLLDLSHVSYVHAATLARNTLQWAQTRPMIKPLERGLRVQRWIVDHTPPSYLLRPEGTRGDQWSSYDFSVPGVFVLKSGYYPSGTAAACNMQEPAGEAPYVTISSQAVTPITDGATFYFFSGGQRRDQATPDKLERQMTLLKKAFDEDRAMIEAQQQVIERSQDKRMMTMSFDGATVQFRRLMDKLMAEETPAKMAS